MRKAKRIVALVLALTMMFALMAMTASAATARGPVCDECRSSNTRVYYRTINLSQETVSGCSKVSGYHIHSYHEDQTMLKCNNCQTDYVIGSSGTYYVCRG